MEKNKTTEPSAPELVKAEKKSAKSTEPRQYVGPVPPPVIGNLPCGCTVKADQLSRDQQDYVLATVPQAIDWFTE